MRELWGNSLWESRETCRQQAFACAASAGASAEATAAEREGPPDEDDTVWNVDADEEFGASAPRRAGLNIVLAKGRGDAGFRQSGRGLISVHSTVEPDERAYALEAYMNAIFAQADAERRPVARATRAVCCSWRARGVLVPPMPATCRRCTRRAWRQGTKALDGAICCASSLSAQSIPMARRSPRSWSDASTSSSSTLRLRPISRARWMDASVPDDAPMPAEQVGHIFFRVRGRKRLSARATRLDAVPVLVLIIKCCHQNFFFFCRRHITLFILSFVSRMRRA